MQKVTDIIQKNLISKVTYKQERTDNRIRHLEFENSRDLDYWYLQHTTDTNQWTSLITFPWWGGMWGGRWSVVWVSGGRKRGAQSGCGRAWQFTKGRRTRGEAGVIPLYTVCRRPRCWCILTIDNLINMKIPTCFVGEYDWCNEITTSIRGLCVYASSICSLYGLQKPAKDLWTDFSGQTSVKFHSDPGH